jgi:hypothetical protein
MASRTECETPEGYADLAGHCFWEADRTLDREVARSLRSLADRFKRKSERSEATMGRRNG